MAIRVLYTLCALCLIGTACTSDEDSAGDKPGADASTGGVPGSGGTSPSGGGSTAGGTSNGGSSGSSTGGSSSGGVTGVPDSGPPPGAPACDTSAQTDEPGGPQALRPDIGVRRVANTGGDFVRMVRDPASGSVYVMDRGANVFELDVAGQTLSLAYDHGDIGGADSVQGLAAGPDGTLYVVGNEQVGDSTRAVVRKGTPNGSGGRQWSTLVSTALYPESNTAFDHHFNGIVVSPDGSDVYLASGSRTDHGEEQSNAGAFPGTREVPLTASMFRVPANGQDLVLENDLAALESASYVFARGLRNSFDPAFAPNGDLISGDNGPDADYSEELNWLREGRHYGFPWKLGDQDNAQQLPSYDPDADPRLHDDFVAVISGAYHNDPSFPASPGGFTDPIVNVGPDADLYRNPTNGSINDSSDRGETLSTFTAHRSPLGLSFDTTSALCGVFYQAGFVLSWGAAGGDIPDQGEDLLHLGLQKSGSDYSVSATQIVTGFDRPIDSVLVGTRLYVLDYGGAGTIWEISLPPPAP